MLSFVVSVTLFKILSASCSASLYSSSNKYLFLAYSYFLGKSSSSLSRPDPIPPDPPSPLASSGSCMALETVIEDTGATPTGGASTW